MQKSKAAKVRTSADERLVDAEWAGVDLDALEPVTVEIDPILREKLRNHDELVQLTLRLGQDQIAEAKRVASQTKEKYQRVLRRWIAEGASRARAKGKRKSA